MKLFRRLYLWVAALASLGAGVAGADVRIEDKGQFVAHLQRRNGPVVAIYPGAGIEAQRYNGLVQALLEKDPSLNVLVARFANNYANPVEAKSKLDGMMQYLSGLGWQKPEKVTYLAGHSLGGVFAHGLVAKSELAGLILLGGYLPQSVVGGSAYSVATFPKPILEIGGDLDGRVGLWHQAREYKSYQAWAKDNPESFSHLVVSLEGVNHMEFADGHVLDGDLKANLTLEEAHNQIAEVLSLFLKANQAEGLSSLEVQSLKNYVAQTGEVLRPMIQAEETTASFCNIVQKDLSGIDGGEWANVVLESKRHFSFPAFVLDKSKITSDASGRHLYLPYYVEIPPNPLDISGNELGHPITIACKMRSRESVVTALKVKSEGSEANCADLNKMVMERIFDLLSPVQKVRYAVSGATVEHRTVSLGTGVQWVAKSFALKHDKSKREWTFELPELKTSVDSKPALFAGAHYCKLVAPERAVQWYTRDALLP